MGYIEEQKDYFGSLQSFDNCGYHVRPIENVPDSNGFRLYSSTTTFVLPNLRHGLRLEVDLICPR